MSFLEVFLVSSAELYIPGLLFFFLFLHIIPMGLD